MIEISPGNPQGAASVQPSAEPKRIPARPHRGRPAGILRISL